MVTRHKGPENVDSGDWQDDEGEEFLLESRQGANRITRLASIILLALMAGALVGAWLTRDDGGVASDPGGQEAALESDSRADGDRGIQGDLESDVADDPTPSTEQPAGDTAAVAVFPDPPVGAPFVDATLDEEVFVLSGVVPSEDLKELFEARAELAYAPFHSSRLRVDEGVGGAEWLPDAAEVIGLLPMITDGTIRIQDDSVTLVGRSPNPEYAASFEQTVAELTGLPVMADAIEITNLVPPRFLATIENGQVTLEGAIPSEELLQGFVLGAAAVYGEENVSSAMTVDEGTYTSFWNYTMPGVFQVLARFPSYQIQVENGITSGTLRGGAVFDLNSATISPETAEVLAAAVAVLSRDRSITMTIVGHTDDRGADDLNRRLSLARAQSAVDFLVGAGISPTQLVAEGRGSDEPIAPNDTAEGRALNRRIEFILQ